MATVQSDIEVANLALVLLGSSSTLTAPEDPGKAGLLYRVSYVPARDALMRGFTWNFATHRDSRSVISETPAWGFDYYYELPGDCLRLVKIDGDEDPDTDWVVEGRRVLCNFDSPINIKYLRRITQPGLYDPLFVQALAAKLAYQWCTPLNRSASLLKLMAENFSEALRVAASCDSVEKTPEVIQATTWISSRWTGTAIRYAKGEGQPY